MYNAISLKNMRRIISPPPFEIILPLNFDDFFFFLNWREKTFFGFFFLEYWCLQFTIWAFMNLLRNKTDWQGHSILFLLSSTPCRKWSTTSTHHPVNRKIENIRLNVINLYLTNDTSKLNEVKKLQPKKKEAFKDSYETIHIL